MWGLEQQQKKILLEYTGPFSTFRWEKKKKTKWKKKKRNRQSSPILMILMAIDIRPIPVDVLMFVCMGKRDTVLHEYMELNSKSKTTWDTEKRVPLNR